jgi:hypothetical protein
MSKDNDSLYMVEGTDHRGRKFRGLYNYEDAAYLLVSDRLNRLVHGTHCPANCDTINPSSNERTI